MTTSEISATLLSWMDIATKRKMKDLRRCLCNCRDILDGLLDIYPTYVLDMADDIRKALSGMNQGDEKVIEISNAFEEKMKEFI